MRVVFIQYGRDITCALMMVESCKRLGYEVWQLSDDVAPKVEGVDVIMREPMHGGRMMYRARRLAEMPAPYVLLDTDMIVSRDISDGMEGDHDVALSWRGRNMVIVKGETEPVYMPYNGGLVFVKNQEFMRDCLKNMEGQAPKWQDWYGDQLALRDVAKSGKYKVLELREGKWNYVPETLSHVFPDVKIYHFKGLRKNMMPDFAKVAA